MSEGEFAAIERLRARFATHAPQISTGIGDDAAVLRAQGQVVLSVDTQVEGVHFDRAWLTLADIGYRATVAALSDLAAMAATPLGVLAAVTLPSPELLDALSEGQAEAARDYGVPVIGGNLSRGASLSIATTVVGQVAQPVLRGGARVGDGVFVAGALGEAAAGLCSLQQNLEGPFAPAWRRPRAQLALATSTHGWASAGIDVSDGLAQDLEHLARASGVRVQLDRAALAPFAARLASEAARLGRDPWEWLCFGGEDYALAMTGAASVQGFVPIGEITAGEGVWLDSVRIEGGHDHFASR